MGSKWEVTVFGNAPLEIIDGDRGNKYPKLNDFQQSGYCLFLNAGNVTCNGFDFSHCSFISHSKDTALRKGKLQRNDIVLTTRGTVGNVAFFDGSVPYEHIRINSGMVIIRAQYQKIRPRFLYMFLKSNLLRSQIESLRTGSAQPQLPIRDINRIKIVIPPALEQEAIAHILGTLDEKIELNRRMNETLEAMARALFKSWFVDFDPVRAKAEGRNTGLPSEISDLFPDEFVDSELGEIPKGWGVRTLAQVFEINPSRTLKKDQVAPYLDMANMPTKGHCAVKVIDRAFASGTRFINGDTLLARITPCLENGKTALVDFLEENQVGWGSTEYIVLRPIPPLPEEFAYCLARSPQFRDHAIQSMTGTSGRQRVQTDSLASFSLSLPLEAGGSADAFKGIVRPLFQRITSSQSESGTLSSLRDTLLPKLISGEIRVEEAEKYLEVVET